MREVKELEVYKEYKDLLELMIADNVVMASDLVRFLILHDEGGIYLDFDQVVYEYDERVNRMGGFVGYTTEEFSFGYLVAETSMVGARAGGHPIVVEFMEQARRYMGSGSSFMQRS